MAFNNYSTKAPKTVKTHEGATAKKDTAKHDLTMLVLGSYLNTDKFYEANTETLKRMSDLVKKAGSAYVEKLAVVARKEFNMRTPPTVLLALNTLNGVAPSSEVASNVMFRGDEVTEYLSAVKALSNKKKFTASSKKVAANLLNGYTERKALRYMGGSKDMVLADAIRIAHPIPTNDKQSALFKFISAERKLGSKVKAWESLTSTERASLPLIATAVSGEDNEGEISWERARSAGKSWEEILDNMGYMAVLRNLRNFLGAVPASNNDFWNTVTKKISDPEEVRNSKQMTYRFYSAYKVLSNLKEATPKVKKAVSDAIESSVYNVPTMPGKTLVAIDVSGSMEGGYISTSGRTGSVYSFERNVEDTTYLELASVMGSAMAHSQNADLVAWATVAKQVKMADTVLSTVDAIGRANVGHGTDPNTIAQAVTLKDYDQIIIFTDGQFASYWDISSYKGKVFFVDLSGYGRGTAVSSRENVVSVSGWSDALFKLITKETGEGGIVDFVENYKV